MNSFLLAVLLFSGPLFSYNKQANLINELDKIEYEVGKLQEKVDTINNSIKSESESIADLENQLQFKSQEMSAKKKIVKERLRGLLFYSIPERLNFLITTDDYESINRSESVVLRMLKKDQADYKSLEEDYFKINSLKSCITKEKIKLEEDSKNYAVYLEDLKQARDKKLKLLEQVKSTKQGYKALARRFARGSEKISHIAGGVRTPNLNKIRGYAYLYKKLLAPLKGKILNVFGKVWDTKTKNWAYNKGVTVQAEYGKEVHSVAAGGVSFSGWILGYGRVLIIKHKENLFSVYAHLARGLFNTGDTVSKGSVIGYVGDSGSVEQSSLYFELRYLRNNIDPTPLFY